RASGSFALRVAITGGRATPTSARSRSRSMSRRKNDPLRPLTADEQEALAQWSRSQAAPAAQVTRAKLLLLVAAGSRYQDAARAVGRKSGDAVAALVARFNREGLAALAPRHGGGRPKVYDARARTRILTETQRTPRPRTTVLRPGRCRP